MAEVERDQQKGEGGNGGIEVNPELCTGCGLCGMVCSLVKEGTTNPRWGRIRVLEKDGGKSHEPQVCEKCQGHPCREVCEEDAIRVYDGVVVIDKTLCTDCGDCIEVCPYDGIHKTPDGKIVMCDTCGQTFPCTDFCSTEAIKKPF